MGSNAIEVLVQSLPRRIGAEEIVNVRGIGYRLKAIGQPQRDISTFASHETPR